MRKQGSQQTWPKEGFGVLITDRPVSAQAFWARNPPPHLCDDRLGMEFDRPPVSEDSAVAVFPQPLADASSFFAPLPPPPQIPPPATPQTSVAITGNGGNDFGAIPPVSVDLPQPLAHNGALPIDSDVSLSGSGRSPPENTAQSRSNVSQPAVTEHCEPSSPWIPASTSAVFATDGVTPITQRRNASFDSEGLFSPPTVARLLPDSNLTTPPHGGDSVPVVPWSPEQSSRVFDEVPPPPPPAAQGVAPSAGPHLVSAPPVPLVAPPSVVTPLPPAPASAVSGGLTPVLPPPSQPVAPVLPASQVQMLNTSPQLPLSASRSTPDDGNFGTPRAVTTPLAGNAATQVQHFPHQHFMLDEGVAFAAKSIAAAFESPRQVAQPLARGPPHARHIPPLIPFTPLTVPEEVIGDGLLHKLVSYDYASDDVLDSALLSGAAVNVRNAEGKTPLHLAAQLAYFHGMEALARFGADLDQADHFGACVRNSDGQTC
jgi:hypothetical protein